jgi:hypothetical protein
MAWDDNTRPNLFPEQPSFVSQIFPSPGEAEEDIIRQWKEKRRRKRPNELAVQKML